MPVPGAALRLMYGEMASVVTTGQHAIPARLQATEYAFTHSEIDDALAAAMNPALAHRAP